MDILPFDVAALPRIVFGAGRLHELPELVVGYGRRVLVVTGARALRDSPHWLTLQAGLRGKGCVMHYLSVTEEPSPQLVDQAVQHHRGADVEVVVGIGGGSVLDAAKAIAGLLPFGNSVLDHLEGVGRGIPYTGPALPFIAVPTTAGTGSEATKNAVLSVRGEQGYKKSFRHDTLVPRVALVDPELLSSCPPAQIAANGMDAFTQLLESYVSSKASPFTDALAWSGMQAVRDGFFAAWQGGDAQSARAGRSAMAYAALLSGITLAQAGLGSVHGLAAPLGAFFPIPHGVACGTLLAAATEVNIRVLEERAPHSVALTKYAGVGRLLSGQPELADEAALQALLDVLRDWTACLGLAPLREFGISEAHLDKIVANCRGASMQTNPVRLSDQEVGQVLRMRL